MNNQETISTLKDMLHQAEQGELIGLAYVAMKQGSQTDANVVGQAYHRPTFCLGMLKHLECMLTELVPGRRR